MNDIYRVDQSEWLSTKIWGIKWQEYFPAQYDNGITVSPTDFRAVASFMAMNMEAIYRENSDLSPFLKMSKSDFKRRFYEEAADFFMLSTEGREIGILTANPSDWGTYYLRNVSILTEYQNRGVFQPFFVQLLQILSKHGVERAEAEVSPSNLGQVHLLNKLGFNVTGFSVSERFGTLTKFTKYFSHYHEENFIEQFCFGVKPQLNSNTERRMV